MPYNLRLVALLFLAALITAPISLYVIHRQSVTETRTTAEQLTRGNAARGKLAITRYGCGACHEIEGVKAAHGDVGPALDGIAERVEIAGKLSNQPDNMIRWIRRPQEVAPGNGMPDLGVSDRDGRDIAAYLYTLRSLTPP
jgi:cytochrome c2